MKGLVDLKDGPVLVLVSLNHRLADIGSRECLRLRLEDAGLTSGAVKGDEVVESVTLDTCNRWELYARLRHAADAESLAQRMERVMGPAAVCSSMDEGKWILLQGAEVVRHLNALCVGLDSQMIGETEIFGQVKQAFADACAKGTAGPCLHRVFQKAFHVAKYLRSQTSIGKGQVSIGSVSVDLAMRVFGDLKPCRVLVVGSGEVGNLAAQSLRLRGIEKLVFTGRNAAKVAALAKDSGGDTCDFSELESQLWKSDIVISCTAAPGRIITREMLAERSDRRRETPVFFIDLAVPRDVEPSVAELDQVFLYNLDDVSAIANENMNVRRAEIAYCRDYADVRALRLWDELVRRMPGN